MKKFPAWGILCAIALIAGLCLGMTNALTADRIEEQNLAAAELARKTVMPAADSFDKLEVAEDAAVDYCYKAGDVGYVAQVTISGYGGPIEVTVGIANDGTLTGISVGGSGFSETAGLGAKTKDVAFTSQFAGLTTPVALTKKSPDGNVDSVTGASISSGAVCDAVNIAAEYIAGIA